MDKQTQAYLLSCVCTRVRACSCARACLVVCERGLNGCAREGVRTLLPRVRARAPCAAAHARRRRVRCSPAASARATPCASREAPPARERSYSKDSCAAE
eukprot:4692457-Pleurochrysis_carterae.AAC.3